MCIGYLKWKILIMFIYSEVHRTPCLIFKVTSRYFHVCKAFLWTFSFNTFFKVYSTNFKTRLIFKTDILLLFTVCLGFLKFLYRNMKMKSIAISNVFYYYHYFFYFLVKRVIKTSLLLITRVK